MYCICKHATLSCNSKGNAASSDMFLGRLVFPLSRSVPNLGRFFPRTMTYSSEKLQRPNVGIGVVILRHLKEREQPEVLLIRRGKAPSRGLISFPGGSQELGETIIECAIRESLEETGALLKYNTEWLSDIIEQGYGRVPKAFLSLSSLDHPVPFTAVDVLSVRNIDDTLEHKDSIQYHYCVVEVAATLQDPRQPIVAGDDADEAFWVSCESLDDPDMVPNLKSVVKLALSTFKIPIL